MKDIIVDISKKASVAFSVVVRLLDDDDTVVVVVRESVHIRESKNSIKYKLDLVCCDGLKSILCDDWLLGMFVVAMVCFCPCFEILLLFELFLLETLLFIDLLGLFKFVILDTWSFLFFVGCSSRRVGSGRTLPNFDSNGTRCCC